MTITILKPLRFILSKRPTAHLKESGTKFVHPDYEDACLAAKYGNGLIVQLIAQRVYNEDLKHGT